jgi:hypothetical protein
MENNDLAPHGAILHISWEVHRILPDGKYSPEATASNTELFELRGQDRALTIARLKSLLEIISKEVSEDARPQFNEKKFRESCVQRDGVRGTSRSGMLGMRGPSR